MSSTPSIPVAVDDPYDKEVNNEQSGRGAVGAQAYVLNPAFPTLPTAVPLTYTLTMHACLSASPDERPSFEQVRPLPLQELVSDSLSAIGNRTSASVMYVFATGLQRLWAFAVVSQTLNCINPGLTHGVVA